MKKICKECPGKLPEGKDIVSRTCRILGLCRYCYDGKFAQPSGSLVDDRPEQFFETELEDDLYDEDEHYSLEWWRMGFER